MFEKSSLFAGSKKELKVPSRFEELTEEEMKNIVGGSSHPIYNKEFAESINLKLGYGLYVTEEDYEKYVKGHESRFAWELNYGYVCVVREGRFEFCHYGPSGLTEIKPSTFEENDNLCLCEGVYCFSSDLHNPSSLNPGDALYYGVYEGKYVECVFDGECEEGFEKDTGSTKEFVLLTKEPIKISWGKEFIENLNKT